MTSTPMMQFQMKKKEFNDLYVENGGLRCGVTLEQDTSTAGSAKEGILL